MSLHAAEHAVREGDLDAALANLQEQVRREPAKVDLRVFLFQLLCVLGQWERALTQLNVAAELDAKALPMANMYREAILCELLRAEIFAGKRTPVVFGRPDNWIALLIESLLASGTGRAAEAPGLRAEAFEGAPASRGTLNGERFEWIADADSRLGPVCEAVINGKYFWLPFERLSRLEIEPPVDLRDVVWMPAQFHFTNGGGAVGVIPTRYPGSDASADPGIRMSRRTDWAEVLPDTFCGLGQRVLTTDASEVALMDVRTIVFDEMAAGEVETRG
jgi:type VI secretion system protein ImpE